jgi:hypothetical protein
MKFPWFGQLVAHGYLILAIHRGKSFLVTDGVRDILDPICPHRHTSLLAEPGAARDPRQALGDLVCAGVRAAVVAPERELARWFSWRWYWADSLVDKLVHGRWLVRVDGT